jgi:hypothetical protein
MIKINSGKSIKDIIKIKLLNSPEISEKPLTKNYLKFLKQ